MQYKQLKLSFILLLGLGLPGLQAQTSLNAAGGNISGSGGSVSYSVGQIAYTTNTGTNGIISQGVQQPYEISTVTAIEEAIDLSLSILAYPNPTDDLLQLKVDTSTLLRSMSFQVYDMNGKILQTKKLTETETQIDMSSYVPSTYFVRVISGCQSVKEFKIIKN